MPLMPSCQHCGRTLTDPESQRNGFGPVCAGNIRAQQACIDHARKAVETGAADADLRAAVRCFEKRDSVLMKYASDETVSDLHARQITEIRREIEKKVLRRVRFGSLPPVPEEFASRVVDAGRSGYAPASEMAFVS